MSGSRLPPAPAAPAAAAAPIPAAAPLAARARACWLGELDLERPAVHLLTVELLDRGLGLLGRRHLDEAEPARTARLTVRDDRRRLDPARLGEHFAQPLAGRRERQATDEQPLCHRPPPNKSSAIGVARG